MCRSSAVDHLWMRRGKMRATAASCVSHLHRPPGWKAGERRSVTNTLRYLRRWYDIWMLSTIFRNFCCYFFCAPADGGLRNCSLHQCVVSSSANSCVVSGMRPLCTAAWFISLMEWENQLTSGIVGGKEISICKNMFSTLSPDRVLIRINWCWRCGRFLKCRFNLNLQFKESECSLMGMWVQG